MDQSFDLLLQDEAVLNVMPVLLIKMVVLCEIFLGSLIYLPRPVNDILILYLHQDLPLGSIHWYKIFMMIAWAPGTAMGPSLIATPLRLRKRERATLLRVLVLSLLLSLCNHTFLSIDVIFRAGLELQKITREPLKEEVVEASCSEPPHEHWHRDHQF